VCQGVLKETNSYSGHSEFRHFHTIVPQHPLHAVQVCPVSREAFLEIIPIGEIQEFLFDSRDPSRNMEPIQTVLAFFPKPGAYHASQSIFAGSVATLELRRRLAIASAKLDRHRAEQTKNEAME
jgi:hypothetical protein